jgi:ankyrin repeat and fibronectin type-III domain-containing protein 1
LLDKVRSIIENTDVDVNSLNSDGLSALDIAVLMNNRQMAKLLLQYGALPGPQSSDNLGNYLSSLMFDAEQKLHHLAGICETAASQSFNTRASFSSIIGSTSQSCTGTETERQMGVWEKRIRGLRRMCSGWQQIAIPDPPLSFTIGEKKKNISHQHQHVFLI